jgi:hypothetical protein
MVIRTEGYVLRPVFLKYTDVLADGVGRAVIPCLCASVSQSERLEELVKNVPED